VNGRRSYVDLEASDASFLGVSWKYCMKQCILSICLTTDACRLHHRRFLDSCAMSLMARVGRLCEELDIWL